MEATESMAINMNGMKPGLFMPADVARDFGADFLDERACRQWILAAVHPSGTASCPQCHGELTGIAMRRFWEGKRIRCRNCGKYFTALTGTFLGGCHMSFNQIVLFAVFLNFGIQFRDIAKILKISPETVRLWDNKFTALKRIREMEVTCA
jgi:transposase-like protein